MTQSQEAALMRIAAALEGIERELVKANRNDREVWDELTKNHVGKVNERQPSN